MVIPFQQGMSWPFSSAHCIVPQWNGLCHPAALVPSEDSVVSRATGPLRAALEERGPYGPE